MKKGIILGLIVMSALLIACGQQQYVCPDGRTVDDPSQCPEPDEQPDVTVTQPDDTPPAPEEKPDVPVYTIDEEIQELIDKADDGVTSFRFVYVGPPENLPRDTYYVKGNRITVELAQATDFKISQPYTHVYLNTEDRTAVAYCNVRNQLRCPNGTARYGTVPFEKHYVRTPYQWLNDIQTAEYAGSGPQYEKKSTLLADFTTAGGVSGEMYILEFTGLPGKIKLDNGDSIEFRDLAINSVTDEQVTPPEV